MNTNHIIPNGGSRTVHPLGTPRRAVIVSAWQEAEQALALRVRPAPASALNDHEPEIEDAARPQSSQAVERVRFAYD
jgi:hypothetical protein